MQQSAATNQKILKLLCHCFDLAKLKPLETSKQKKNRQNLEHVVNGLSIATHNAATF